MKVGGSRRYIMSAVEDSLRRLRTDWIDLYQIHQPDPLTPIEETLRALDDLIRQGKVRYIGCSNFPAWQVMEAQWTAKTGGLNAFVSCQDEYSLVFRKPEAELMPAMRRLGLGLLPFFPLASGLLTGKYRRNAALPDGHAAGQHAAPGGSLSDRAELADRRDSSATSRKATATRCWNWRSVGCWHSAPVTSVIAGATKPEQLEQNVKAGAWHLAKEELAAIDRICGA